MHSSRGKCTEFTGNMKDLCRKDGFLFFYVVGGDSDAGHKVGYVCLRPYIDVKPGLRACSCVRCNAVSRWLGVM